MKMPAKTLPPAPPAPPAPQAPAQDPPGNFSFEAAAGRAVRRLVLARWFGFLRQTALPLFLPLNVLVLALHLSGYCRVNAVWFGAVTVSWVVLAALWALAKKPSSVQALALWDKRARRNEMFVSAFCFEFEKKPGRGELLHLERARRRLQSDVGNLQKDLPAPFPHRAWLLPLILIGCAAFDLGEASLPPEEKALDEVHRERARQVGESFADKAKALERLKGLTEEEKKKARKIKASLEETANKMCKLSLKTQRDILAELDRRAREAEKLAEELGFSEDELLSPDMIAELERHTDTADFASAVRAVDFTNIAAQSEKLAERLRNKNLSLEEQKRIENALNKALKAGKGSDKRKLIGKKIDEAEKHLKNNRLLLAAKRFAEIAKHFHKSEQRQQARRQLHRLASALRASGQNIFDRNQAGLKRLKQNRYAGFQPLKYRRLQLMRNMPFGRHGNPNTSGRMALLPGQMSGAGQMQGLLPGSGQAPIPGSNMGQMPGTGMGQTPIPGNGSGMNPVGGSGMGQAPVPGSGACQGAMQGGLMAGHGSAPYGSTPTNPFKPSRTGVVDARRNEDAPSAVRAIDGNLHNEEAVRSTREIAIEFIKIEEEALSEEPLPLSRREQILRYFTALRRQIENEP